MICFLFAGLCGGLMMYAGDMILYYVPEDFAYDAKSTYKEKIRAIVDVMKKIDPKRLMIGGMLGPVSAFFSCLGFYHIVLITDERMQPVAYAAFFLACFGMIAGGAYHSHCSYLGILGEEKYGEALARVENYFQKFPLLYYAAEGTGLLLLAFLIVSGNTVLPRWMFLFSPGILFLLRPAVNRLPKGIRILIAGGWTNLIFVIYYLALLFVLA